MRSACVSWKGISATVYGFGVWWEAELVPGVRLSTAPHAPRTHWEQIYMPVVEPLGVRRGEVLTLRLSVNSHRDIRIQVAWDARVTASSGTVRMHRRMDMLKGQVE